MSDGLSIPLHLAVHLVGLAAVAGLLGHAWVRRRTLGPSWVALALGALLLAVQYLASGLVLAEGTAWPVHARAVAYAAIAVGVAGRANLSGSAPVVVAIAPVSIHVAAGIAGLLAAASALRGLPRRGGLLAAGLASWAGHDMLVRSRPELAGWIAVLGSGLVLGWVGTVSRNSVRARLLASITALVAFAVVLVAAATGTLFTEQFRLQAIDRLQAPGVALANDVNRDWPNEMAAQVATTSRLLETVAIAGRPGIGQPEAEVLRRTGGSDMVVLLSRDGVVLAGSARNAEVPAAWMVALSGAPEVQASAGTREAQIGQALLRADGLNATTIAVYAAAPILPSPQAGIDERIGTLVTARLVDAADVQSRGLDADVDLVVVAGGDVIQSTRGAGEDVAIGAAVAERRDQVLVPDGDGDGELELLLAPVNVGVVGVTIQAAALQEAGILVTSAGDTARDLFVRSLLVLLVSLLGGALASRALARPARQLTRTVERVAEGDFEARVSLDDRDDEFGRLAVAFDDMTVALAARQTALVRAASTEAELRGRLQAITDSMSDGLIATDRDGIVTAANPAAARMTGVAMDDLVGSQVGAHLGGRTGTGDDLPDALADVGSRREQRSVQARLDHDDLDVAITTSPLRGAVGSAPIIGAVLVLRDVSREAELARARRDFVTNISHELRTPLTLIMAPVKQLERWRKRDDIAAIQTEILNRGTARMHRLERELTEWAQVELDRFATVKGEANLDEVLKRSVEMVRWQFPERDIRVKVPRRLEPIGLSNEALQTILRELTHNAVLFSKHGKAHVDVAFRNVEGGVALTVTDRGVGMSADTVARAFEPYWQHDPTERRDFDGLGIGLTLAQRVAEMAGTTVHLVSRPGRGTTATVLLPAVTRA